MANNVQPQRQKQAARLGITKLCLELETRANSDGTGSLLPPRAALGRGKLGIFICV